MIYIFAKEGGNNNNIVASEIGANNDASQAALGGVKFENVAQGGFNETGAAFSLGGEKWATMNPRLAQESSGFDTWQVTLEGRDVGKERDLRSANEMVQAASSMLGQANSMSQIALSLIG